MEIKRKIDLTEIYISSYLARNLRNDLLNFDINMERKITYKDIKNNLVNKTLALNKTFIYNM